MFYIYRAITSQTKKKLSGSLKNMQYVKSKIRKGKQISLVSIYLKYLFI